MIRPRGSSWQVDVQVKGKRWRKDFASKVEAEAAEAMALHRMKRGLPAEDTATGMSHATTLEELIKLTAMNRWRGTPNEKTALGNAKNVVNILGKNRHVSSIKTEDIDFVVSVLKDRKNSAGTINRKLTALNCMLRFAHDRDMLQKLPKVSRQRESQGRIRWYTHEEEDRILGYLRDQGRHDFADLVTFLLDTGCRASEAARAEWRDIDLEDQMVRIWKSKNGKNRTVPIPLRLWETLAERQARRPVGSPATELVFPGWTDPKGRSNRMTRAWSDLMDELGITDKEAVLHALRHTYATRLVQKRVPIQVVQALLGHSTLGMTTRYAHLAPANLKDAVAVLDRGLRHTDRIQSAPEEENLVASHL